MNIRSCIPVVPSADLEKSLKLWREGLGFDDTWYEMRADDGRLIGCGIRKEHMSFMLNRRAGPADKPEGYNGVNFYWAPSNLNDLRQHLIGLGYAVSDVVERDYGQTEFYLSADDGFSHTFGVATKH